MPKSDLKWSDCTKQTLTDSGLGPGPAGLVLECAQFSTPIDAAGSVFGTSTAGALRARLPQTPADAAPLVFTTGTDRPSTVALAALAVGPSNALLASHPVVAVDRRGIGTSAPLDCMSSATRQGLLDNGLLDRPAADPVDAVATLSEQATISCKDALPSQELTFDAPHAADDIEQLRLQWQVDRIGIIGSGNGALVAASYAQAYPQHLARLVLDSPVAFGANASTLAEQRVQGAEAALTAFATRCVALACSLGPDPRAAIADLVRRAGAGQLADTSPNALLTGVAGFLGSPRADQAARTPELADLLSAAGRGNTKDLERLIINETAAMNGDGQFVSGCSDAQQRTPQQQARELRKTWAGKYPIFGEQAAIGLIACTSWPTVNPPALPKNLDIAVLVLSGAADPVTGNGGLSSVTGAFTAAGTRSAVVTWQGWGHPVLPHSACAQQSTVDYLTSGNLPANGMACPA